MKKITVFGGGTVGSSVAKTLSDDGIDVTVVDTNGEVLKDLQEKIDIRTVEGNASYPVIQKAAGVPDTDIVIAVTGNDEINMTACQIARKAFNAPTTIARLRPNDYLTSEDGFDKDFFSIDKIISPGTLLTNYIKNIMDHPGAFQVFEFSEGLLQLIAAKVLEEGPLAGKKLSDFRKHMPNVDVRVVLIYRNGKPIFPTGSTVINTDDEVFFIATEKNMRFMSELRKPQKEAHNVMIAGGGNVGSSLAKNLENIYRVKLTERDKARAKTISEKLSSSVVLNDDISDEEFLRNESIHEVDYFCAVTNDDQINILSAKLAKEMGAKKTIAIINRSSYRSLVSKELDIVVSPADVTIGSILASVRGGDIVNVHSLGRGDAEAIEIKVHGDMKTSKVVGRKISELNLPSTINIGAVIRGEQVVFANTEKENMTIESEDRIILFILSNKDVETIETLFSVGARWF